MSFATLISKDYWRSTKPIPCGGIANAKEKPCGGLVHAMGKSNETIDTSKLQKELDGIKREQRKLHEKLYGDREFYVNKVAGYSSVFMGSGLMVAKYDGEYNMITIRDTPLHNEDAMRLAEFILDNLKEDK